MPINFEDRAVAFIDVLGFKSIVENAENSSGLQLLEELINTLETAVPNLDGTVDPSVPKELIPKHIAISDSIILSAPLRTEEMSQYCGLSIVVMRVIQLTHILLDQGYLIRGGISIGNTWHSDSNIVGPAYQEAYAIETKTGAPRVELSNSAETLWKESNGSTNNMCIDYGGKFVVNGLHDFYIQDGSDGCAQRVFGGYQETIENKIASEDNDKVRYKWWWFSEFLKSEITRNPFIVHS